MNDLIFFIKCFLYFYLTDSSQTVLAHTISMILIKTDSSISYYQKVLAVISALSPADKQLSPLELDTLSRFLDLPPKYQHFPFTSHARRIIYNQYDPPLSISMLSSRVTSLIQKGYLVRDEDNFVDFAPIIKKLRNTKSLDVKIQDISSNRTDS